MKTVLIALLATSGICRCLCAAGSSDPPVALYYSFDANPPDAVLSSMKTEMTGILDTAGLRVGWHQLGSSSGNEPDFREVFVMRFRGVCSMDGFVYSRPADAGSAPGVLANSSIVDEHILPFGEVACDRLRNFIAPEISSRGDDDANRALGRALARVVAHELYHMLTHSTVHARSGIARAQHSRADLLGANFRFGKPENEWLQAWVGREGNPAIKSEREALGGIAALVAQPVATEDIAR